MPYYNPDTPVDRHQRNLPHWQQGDVWIFVTWRLGDALPQSKLKTLREEKIKWLADHPEPWDEDTEIEFHVQFSHRVDKWLDQGMGSCLLRHESLARIVENTLLHFQNQRYHLDCFVIMPNHVHVLFRITGEDVRLDQILKSWKGFSAREINRARETRGTLWQEEYWDRLIRSERHFHKVREYILENPAKAGLKSGFILWENTAE